MWIVNLVTAVPRGEKLTLYADTEKLEAERLSESVSLPEGIRLLESHPLSYAAFDETTLRNGDIFILKEAEIPDFIDGCLAIDAFREKYPEYTYYESDGKSYGILVWDSETGEGVLTDFIAYPEDGKAWLFFGARSVHAAGLTGTGDDAAIALWKQLMEIN